MLIYINYIIYSAKLIVNFNKKLLDFILYTVYNRFISLFSSIKNRSWQTIIL